MSQRQPLPVNNTITDLLDSMVSWNAKELMLQAGKPPVYRVGENRIVLEHSPVLDYEELSSELEALNITDRKIYRYDMFNYVSEDAGLSRILSIFISSREPELVVTFREKK